MRRDHFLIGLGIRILTLGLFIHINQTTTYNDASLIIYQGFRHIFQGENPYAFTYLLQWGTGSFSQPLNYGPLIFFLYLPAMLIPLWYNDLWIGIAIMMNVYSFLTAETLIRVGESDGTTLPKGGPRHEIGSQQRSKAAYYGGVLYWCVPFGTTIVTGFIYCQIFLITYAFAHRERPLTAGLALFLASLSYQLVLLIIPIYGVYYLRKSWRHLWAYAIGAVFPGVVFVFFVFWQYPAGTIDSLFLYSSSMPYVKCPTCANALDSWSVFSVPQLVYRASGGGILIGPTARLVMLAFLGLICLIALFSPSFLQNTDSWLLKYQVVAVIAFTLTTNYGQLHYLFFLPPLLILLYHIERTAEKSPERSYTAEEGNNQPPKSPLQDVMSWSLRMGALALVGLMGMVLLGRISWPNTEYWVEIYAAVSPTITKWVAFLAGVVITLVGSLMAVKRKRQSGGLEP